MKKLRLTPLNIVAALAFALLVLTFFQKNNAGQHFDMKGFYQLILGALVVVAFVTDMIFRFAIKDLKEYGLSKCFSSHLQ